MDEDYICFLINNRDVSMWLFGFKHNLIELRKTHTNFKIQ